MSSDVETLPEPEDHFCPAVRLVEVERGDSSTCGFHLTRGKWDPYPWVSKIDPTSVADEVGMLPGDCLLEVNGEDVVGKRISEIALLIKRQSNVSLLLWNAGVDERCSPETLCCGPMPNNFQRLSACTNTILNQLECPVCLDTSVPPVYQCDNGHLICTRCRSKTERCPVCRLRLTRGRSLLADSVYNAILDAFELRSMPQEVRNAKIQQIFNGKMKKSMADIKISHKYLARLLGKASSVDNLSVKSTRRNGLLGEPEFGNNLKAKSLSSSEIFDKNQRPRSPNDSSSSTRCTSIESIVMHREGGLMADGSAGILFHCPFNADCAVLIKGCDLISHFQRLHEGPLVEYFKSTITVKLNEAFDTYLICLNRKYFVLKILRNSRSSNELNNLRTQSNMASLQIWAWLLGSKKHADDFQLLVNLYHDKMDNVLLRTRSPLYSLNSVSWADMKDHKRTIFLNASALNLLNLADRIFNDLLLAVLNLESLKAVSQYSFLEDLFLLLDLELFNTLIANISS